MKNGPDKDNVPQYLAKGYILLFALLPWSVDVDFGSWNMQLPSEPLILLLGFALALEIAQRTYRFFKAGKSRPKIKPRDITHYFLPGITFVWILWMGIAASCSSMKIVSMKYWLVEAGHCWVFAVGIWLWPGLWRRVLPWFVLSMLGVAAYTIIHHGFYHFRNDQALLAPMPFFPDHTMYAAVLAVLLFYAMVFDEKDNANHLRIWNKSWFKTPAMIFLGVALLISTCRAAQLSVGLSALIFAGCYLKGNWHWIIPGIFVLGLCSFPLASKKISRSLHQDVSSMERLNRWECSKKMLALRPWTGFGPGTFPFQYLPFQQPENMTRISLHMPVPERGPDTYGRGGSAHSEYWQAAAEQGLPGLLLWILLVTGALGAGLRRILYSPERSEQRIALVITLGLFTFFTHALVNNFLHDGRIAALVWGGMFFLLKKPAAKSSP